VTTISTSPPSCDSGEVARNLAVVRERIAAAGGDASVVRVVAVTKGFGFDAVRAALGAGLVDIGENYVSELVDKAQLAWQWGEESREESDEDANAQPQPPPRPRWHFLGAVQRNKVASLAPFVGVWQTVAREAEGARIARFAPGAAVMVEVETTGLPGRNGCPSAAVPDLVANLLGLGLDVRGLMTVAAPDRASAAVTFESVVRLADDLGLPERSMGMSDDLEVAVSAGSTMVRIGRALFGKRPARGRSGLPAGSGERGQGGGGARGQVGGGARIPDSEVRSRDTPPPAGSPGPIP
jgi:PLP dependent protein